MRDRGFLERENKSLEGSSPTIRAVMIIFSLASSTYSISLLNRDI